MSEAIPESIPTSHNPRSKRPTKKRALTPVSAQAATLTALFSHPDQVIAIPHSVSASTDLTTAGQAQYSGPEIVANVQGSSAGAGSGEFHVYKASRRREYERVRAMDEEVRREKDTESFERERREREERDRERTEKNRKKREKLKSRKNGKGQGQKEAEVKGGKVAKNMVDISRTVDGDANMEEATNTEQVGLIIHDDD